MNVWIKRLTEGLDDAEDEVSGVLGTGHTVIQRMTYRQGANRYKTYAYYFGGDEIANAVVWREGLLIRRPFSQERRVTTKADFEKWLKALVLSDYGVTVTGFENITKEPR